jgi:hypothetical protein
MRPTQPTAAEATEEAEEEVDVAIIKGGAQAADVGVTADAVDAEAKRPHTIHQRSGKNCHSRNETRLGKSVIEKEKSEGPKETYPK